MTFSLGAWVGTTTNFVVQLDKLFPRQAPRLNVTNNPETEILAEHKKNNSRELSTEEQDEP